MIYPSRRFRVSVRAIPPEIKMKAQKYIDRQVLRLCDPYTPKDTGVLIGSGTRGTVLGSGKVTYNCIYARRQYYEGRSRSMRGRKWFARMKADRGSEILQGLQRLLKG